MIIFFILQQKGKVLENPKNSPPELYIKELFLQKKLQIKKQKLKLHLKMVIQSSINGKKLSPEKLLQKLNLIAGKNGIGRVDLVENRFIGIKSRGVYETPGGTVLYVAHRAIESVTLIKKLSHAKERVMPEYAELVYNGYWFSKRELISKK